MERIYNLPDDLIKEEPSSIHIFFYQTNKSSRNNKVSFGHNLISFMQEGEKEVSGSGINERFTNMHIYLLGKSNVLMTENVTEQNLYKSILLFFSNSYLINFLRQNDIKTENIINGDLYLKVDKDDFILNFEKSLELLKESLWENQNLLKTKIDELLLYLIKTSPEAIKSIFNAILKNDRNASITNVISANTHKNLIIEELAFLCNMSISTFKRKFAEVYGTTPKKYFIYHRMHQAVKLLKDNKRPTEIYAELGYEDLSAFSTEFKKYFGISPKAYIAQKMNV